MITNQQTLRLDGPGELLEVVPYLLGFHPEASVVLVGLDESRLTVTARLDLDAAREPSAIGHGVRTLWRAEACAVAIIVYAAPGDCVMRSASSRVALPHVDVVEQVSDVIEAAAMSVPGAYFVQDGHWWSYAGRATGCPGCIDGEPLPGDHAVGPATAIFAGLQARPSRAALEAVLDQDPAPERERCRSEIEAAEQVLDQAALDGRLPREQRSVKRALFAAARDTDRALFPDPRPRPKAPELGRFATGLSDVSIRDALWLAVDQGRLDGRAFWLQLLQRLPAPYDAAPLFLFGWASWRDGNGTLAAMAAQRALGSHPGYTAAELLLSALDNGLDPYRTPKLRSPGRA